MLWTREYGPLTTGFTHFGEQIQHICRNIAYIPPVDGIQQAGYPYISYSNGFIGLGETEMSCSGPARGW